MSHSLHKEPIWWISAPPPSSPPPFTPPQNTQYLLSSLLCSPVEEKFPTRYVLYQLIMCILFKPVHNLIALTVTGITRHPCKQPGILVGLCALERGERRLWSHWNRLVASPTSLQGIKMSVLFPLSGGFHSFSYSCQCLCPLGGGGGQALWKWKFWVVMLLLMQLVKYYTDDAYEMHAHTYTCNTHTHACTHARTHAHAHTHTHTHTLVHARTHTCTHWTPANPVCGTYKGKLWLVCCCSIMIMQWMFSENLQHC